MSRELVIVFLYDCNLCKCEEDDPQEAIIYFYPTWVSGEQRHALCSQLMGVTQFCTTAFTSPSVISLQSGKFAVVKTGRFALCVGTDRNISDVVLRNRLSSLYKMLRLFHCSVEFIDATLSDDDDNLCDTFSQLLQTYLPIVLDGANPFENIPLFKIPKNSNVISEAKRTLQQFQTMKGVLGGVVIYQNKVIDTQLNPNLTKQIVLAQPHKIKLPAYYVETPFHLPNGVQLMTVFIDEEEVIKLRAQAEIFCLSGAEISPKGNIDRNVEQIPETGAKSDLQEERPPDPVEDSPPKSRRSVDVPDGCFPSISTGTHRNIAQNLVRDVKDADTLPFVPDLVMDTVRAREVKRKGNWWSRLSPASRLVMGETSKTTDDILSTTNIPMRYYSIGLPKMDPKWTDGKRGGLERAKKEYFNTICDPKYPLFKPDGLPASFNFYSDQTYGLKEHRLDMKKELKKSEDVLAQKTSEKGQRQLSLSLSKYSDRPPPKDIPLTPLLAKLSIDIASEEIFIDFSSSDVETSDRETTSELSSNTFGTKSTHNDGVSPTFYEKSSDVVKLALFVYSRNSSSVVILIEKSVEADSEFIHSLWEKSNDYLKKLEAQIDLDTEGAGIEVSTAGEYSYAIIDQDWGPTERGGFHKPIQLEMLSVLHETLNSLPQVTDLLVREEDSVTYGYRWGASQVFYQQNCTNNLGVPTPTDLMGVIPLKATSILRRDHNVVNA